jgi:hypothetical protein
MPIRDIIDSGAGQGQDTNLQRHEGHKCHEWQVFHV